MPMGCRLMSWAVPAVPGCDHQRRPTQSQGGNAGVGRADPRWCCGPHRGACCGRRHGQAGQELASPHWVLTVLLAGVSGHGRQAAVCWPADRGRCPGGWRWAAGTRVLCPARRWIWGTASAEPTQRRLADPLRSGAFSNERAEHHVHRFGIAAHDCGGDLNIARGSRCCQASVNPAPRATCPRKARCARPLPSRNGCRALISPM